MKSMNRPKKEQEEEATATAAEGNNWTTDHHLVGKHSVTRTLLCSATSASAAATAAADTTTTTTTQPQQPFYVYQTHTVPLRAFEPEHPAERKPALWRGIIVGTAAAATSEEEDDDHKKTTHHEDDQEQQQLTTAVVARAVDCVAADFQQQQQQQTHAMDAAQSQSQQVLPTGTATRVVQERYASVVYQHVLQNILPPLILKAAVEECQAQFLQQQQQVLPASASAAAGAAATASATTTSYYSSLSSSSSAPSYYRHSPSSYLVPPSTAAAASATGTASSDEVTNHSILPVTFTPSQLVARIKQGCALAWQEMAPLLLVQQQQQQLLSQEQQQSQTTTSSSFAWDHQRRASSRLARQQQQQQQQEMPKTAAARTTATTDAFQKVTPGGQIALYLKEKVLATATTAEQQQSNHSQETSNEPQQQDKDMKQDHDHDDDNNNNNNNEENETGRKQEEEAPPVVVKLDNSRAPNDNNNNNNNIKADEENATAAVTTTTTTTKDEDEKEAAVTTNGENKGKGDVDGAGEEIEVDENGGDDDNEEEEAAVGDEKEDDEYAPEEEGEDGDEDDEDGVSYVKERADVLHVDMNDGQEGDKMEEDCDDNEGEEENEEEAEEEVDLIHDDNPYMQATGLAILEWLGRKTAKHLSTADIQVSFPSLLAPKQTKKKKASPKEMAKIGGDTVAFLTQTDRLIWHKMLPNYGQALLTPGARFLFQIVNEEDTSEIDQWESSSFGRSQFTVRIWNQEAEEEIAQRAYDEYAVAEMEYRDAKAWGTWRFKGINTGYTVWPSWLDAVEAWRKEKTTGETMPTAETSAADEMQQQDQSDVVNSFAIEDLELAQALAEQEATVASTATRRSRRAAEGGGGGVFYGTQSNMTQKQLMDTILRLVSQNSYQTAMSIMQAIPDESTDPLRRIRAAIGKLDWKRNQLAKQVVHPSWSDAAVWAAVSQASLISVDPDKESTLKTECNDAEKIALLKYIQELHKTELRLRQMVLDHLADIPIAVIATSADERAGSLEAMDDVDFENGAADKIEWHSAGHSLLGKLIYRPATTSHTDDIAPCQWYRVRDFSDPIASEPEEGESAFERPSIGTAKEATAVRRRSRFRAFPAVIDGSSNGGASERLILTEGQVFAGMKAAELEQRHAAIPGRVNENPFAGARSSLVTLIPPENSSGKHVTGTIVGHDSIIDGEGSFHQRILLLLDEETPQKETVWVRLSFPDSGVTECRIEGDPSIYTIQQFEYHSSSPAFQECRNIVDFLIRHTKAGPFLEPVDPVALNIPDYFNVIKNPMDICTLADNLDAGKYSNIPPREAKGRSPTARMLNGPFRKDVELIFDNAMLFNPPVDWIHQSAMALKKAVTRKIDQAVKSAEEKFVGRSREKHSIYVEEDSDADMYVYESDDDEEYIGSRGGRKRKRSENRTPVKEESSTRSIERPIRLQKVLSESMGLRGALSNIPVNTDSSSFSLPSGWVCRLRKAESPDIHETSVGQVDIELDELISLYKVMEEREASGLRRSTRTHHMESEVATTRNGNGKSVEYFFEHGFQDGPNVNEEDDALPRNRSQIELAREKMHEDFYARLYQKLQKALACGEHGGFSDGSFPPFLGSVVPAETSYRGEELSSLQSAVLRWEIRDTYLIPALHWVIRGLIRSNHLSELEPVDSSTDTGVILPNHVYYLDPKAEPFDVVDVRELTRKKRANDAAAESSDEEVELSAYEKMRAERVARNEERLKALGLA